MKRFFAVFTVLVLLCSCSTAKPTENTGTDSKSTSEISNEGGFESSFETAKAIPAGYQEVDFGEFSLLICENSFSGCAPMEIVTIKNNQFVGNNNQSKRVIAELLAIEDAVDKGKPFVLYDAKYSSAVNTVELSFNGFSAKKYHIQTQIDKNSSGLSNKIFYCIYLNDKIITFAYYPVMGYGGMHAEDIESVLDTIRLK